MIYRGALAGAALLLGACATTPIVLSGRYDAPALRDPSAPACRIALGPVSDERLDPKVIGQVGARMVYSPPDVAAWIASAFTSLTGPEGAVVAGAGDTGLEVHLGLVSASVRSATTSIATNVVIRARWRRGGQLAREAVYRGDDASMNWTGGADEIEGRINIALGRILQAARADVALMCRPAAP